MKRYCTIMINGSLCMIISSVLRLLIAIPHRQILQMVRPVKLYDLESVFPWRFRILVLLIAGYLYCFAMEKFCDGVTVGERITGIRVRSNRKIWNMLLEMVSVMLYQITAIWIWVTGKMPYDEILGVEIYDNHKRAADRTISKYKVFLLLVAGLIFSMFYWKIDETKYIPFGIKGPAEYLSDIDIAASAYTGCLELGNQYTGMLLITEKEMGEREKAVFSESGKEKPWAFVSTTEKHFMEQYKNLGIDGWNFDFEKNVIVVTFGRKLNQVRLMDDSRTRLIVSDEMHTNPYTCLRLELDNTCEDNTIYFYQIPRMPVYRFVDMETHSMFGIKSNPRFCEVVWMNTDYDLYKTKKHSASVLTIKQEGQMGRWGWAFTYVGE